METLGDDASAYDNLGAIDALIEVKIAERFLNLEAVIAYKQDRLIKQYHDTLKHGL